MKLFLVKSLLFIAIAALAQTPRGRVTIQDGTLVTDKGTLLRGAYVSTDITTNMPAKEDISGIKNLGLNCVHLYAECPQYQTAGDRETQIDSIVKWTEEDSLYLIMTIGGCNENGKFDSTFVYDFWNKYALKYKDKTHMVYEIVNEPFSWSSPYDSVTLDMERWAYDLIRSHAPETHILLMSYAQAVNETSIIEDLKKLGTGIEWSKTSIASHGYGIASDEMIYFTKTLRDSGYAVTITEPEAIENIYTNLATTRIFENNFISYTLFISVQNIINNPSVFKSEIESSEIRWKPDFGTWPMSLTGINYRNPYQTIKSGFYDEGYGFHYMFEDEAIGFVSNNDYIAFYNLDFEDGPAIFEAQCSSESNECSIELHLDSINGPLVGVCPITPTGSWDIYQTFSCTLDEFTDVYNLYLVFKGGIWDLLNLKNFVFKKAGTILIEPTKLDANRKIGIYPNPAKDFLHITVNENALIEIYNLQGQKVKMQSITPENNTVSICNLISGSYIVKVSCSSQNVNTVVMTK